MQHDPVRQGDQFSCVKCGKAWDVEDLDPPPCLTKQESDQKHINELRDIMSEKHSNWGGEYRYTKDRQGYVPASRYEGCMSSHFAQSVAAVREVLRYALERIEEDEEKFFVSRLASLGLDKIKEAHRRPQRVSFHQHLTALEDGHWKEMRIYGHRVAITRNQVVHDEITLTKECVPLWEGIRERLHHAKK